MRPATCDQVNNPPVTTMPDPYVNQSHGQSEDLPKNVVRRLRLFTAVTSMDFHPGQQILLLVGTGMGNAMTWEVGRPQLLTFRTFEVWELGACSATLQETLANDNTASVNRVRWSPDGTLLGVAYSKLIVHLYVYKGGQDLRNHLEIEAHFGNVYDLAFAHPNKQLCIVTCGDDRLVKVWDTVTGSKKYSFDGHEAPVYSICPLEKSTSPFVLSTTTDGKIKFWYYDDKDSTIECDAPGHSSTMVSCSADGTRLFSCGTNKEGESFLVELNNTGAVQRTFCGLAKRSVGLVQFDTAKNFLAAADDFLVKFWDIDNLKLLTSTDADGGLPGSPCIRFHPDGILLAVSTNDNDIKILANTDGIKLLRTIENRTSDVTGAASAAIMKPPTIGTLDSVNMTVGTSIGDQTPEINEPVQCRSLKLPDFVWPQKVSRLIYANSGVEILALASNGVLKLWRWKRNEQNLSGKATTNADPQFWQPSRGIVISDTNPENAVPCLALPRNEGHVLSSSGGYLSDFLMQTLKTFMPPPPAQAATFLAFHPQDDNVVAMGMDDSSVLIFNVQTVELKIKLQEHKARVTGLAFSNILNVLASSGADSLLCIWSTDGWTKKARKLLKMPIGRAVAPLADTHVQFHTDGTHLLAIHETQLTIYTAPKLAFVRQWVPGEGRGPITHGTYSCDSLSIYATFADGSVGVLSAKTLVLRCQVNPNAYLPYNPRLRVYPLVIAAHPSEPYQFAIGLSDTTVYVIEPTEADGKWRASAVL